MQNSDLVEILEVLTKVEQNELLFQAKRAHKLKPECFSLLQHLILHLQGSDRTGLTKDAIYKVVYPGKPWVDNKLAKLTGETLNWVRKYIAEMTALKQLNELQHLYYLLIFYQERNLEPKFWTTRQRILHSKKETSWQTPADFHLRFLSEHQTLIYKSIFDTKKGDLNIVNAIKALDEYYLLQRLYLSCYFLNQSLIAPIQLEGFDPIHSSSLNLESADWFFEQELGKLFLKVMPFLDKIAKPTIPELLEFLSYLRHLESIIHPDFTNLFELIAINYCARRLNEGEANYQKILFDTYKHRVITGRIYLEKKMINPSEFLNLTILALRLKDFIWAKQFIENHKNRVLGVMPSLLYYEFAMANYLFHTGDYQETCKILMTSDYQDIQCILSSRILEIKALSERFYRQNADHRVGEYLEDRVEAAILFFFRLKDVEITKKKMGKRFSDTMKRIIHAEGKRDAARLEIILQDIGKAEYIAERQWLSKLAEDLILKHKK